MWFPQRVLDVHVLGDYQHVVTLGDLQYREEGVVRTEFASVLHAPLYGAMRRWALGCFGLNVHCEKCGARGVTIRHGMTLGSGGPHTIDAGYDWGIGSPDYACLACGAQWLVLQDGKIEFVDSVQVSLGYGQ